MFLIVYCVYSQTRVTSFEQFIRFKVSKGGFMLNLNTPSLRLSTLSMRLSDSFSGTPTYTQFEGRVALPLKHWKPTSVLQRDEHPSPLMRLPSSQTSDLLTIKNPSPQMSPQTEPWTSYFGGQVTGSVYWHSVEPNGLVAESTVLLTVYGSDRSNAPNKGGTLRIDQSSLQTNTESVYWLLFEESGVAGRASLSSIRILNNVCAANDSRTNPVLPLTFETGTETKSHWKSGKTLVTGLVCTVDTVWVQSAARNAAVVSGVVAERSG